MSSTSRPLFYVEYVSDEAATELLLNDVPQARFGGHAKFSGFIPVPLDLVRGRNMLELRFWAAPTRPIDPARPFATARLARFADGERAFDGGGDTIASLDLPGTEPVRTTFDSQEGPASWPWQAAEPTSPEMLVEKGFQPFVQRLAQAWFDGDPAPFLSASAMRFTDSEQAFRTRPASAMATQLDAWITGMGPLPPAARRLPPLVVRPCGQGRLIDLSAADGDPWLRRPDADGDVAKFTARVGYIGSAWQILR
ncbi:hypothetical protein [Sphingomonas jatrophae]|uniref:Uncharacterized protein n=1 Tax=Sphingomonas jatrophae TaxID=1166337 RepID=A0A1I6KXP8_9SPHN|nr:hypothetical protein [Sphingomonas jatrophae]SFR95999.1 hypothetical protein SAMN05192580_1900 [Sphingomonas jatrophae]